MSDLEQPEDQSILETILDRIGYGLYQIKSYILVELLCLSEGAGMISMTFLSYILKYVVWNKSLQEISMISSAVFVGSGIGGVLAGFVSDRYGRKICLVFAAILTGSSGLISAFSPNIAFLTFIRGIFGIGFGLMVPATISFSTEITPKKYRGLDYVNIVIGFVLGQLVGVMIAALLEVDKPGSENWRVMIAWDAFPGILSAILFWFYQSESPRFEILRDKKSGLEVYNKMHHMNKGTDLQLSQEELQQVDDWINLQNQKQIEPTFVDLFKNGWWKITLPMWGLTLTQNTLYYGNMFILPHVLDAIETKDDSAAGVTAPEHHGLHYWNILSLVLFELPAQLIASVMVRNKKFGRRNSLMIVYGLEMCLLIFMYNNPHFVSWGAPIQRLFGSAAYTFIGAYISELYHTKIRSTGIGFANCADRVGGTLMPFVMLRSMSIASTGPYLILSFYAFFAFIFCYLLAYDTTMRDLDKSNHKDDEKLLEMHNYKNIKDL